eukprot:symbB.v1.2.013580.t2/scaffold962.1/size148607/6
MGLSHRTRWRRTIVLAAGVAVAAIGPGYVVPGTHSNLVQDDDLTTHIGWDYEPEKIEAYFRERPWYLAEHAAGIVQALLGLGVSVAVLLLQGKRNCLTKLTLIKYWPWKTSSAAQSSAMALKQPVGQKRLTNVAVVRMKCHGMRFEIACYKNKVLNWREGIEKDLNEVLQTETVFTNVSKAVIAKEKDLQKAFGTVELPEICKKILKDGDVQVSDKEREVHMESIFKDIVQILAERLIHTETGRQLTPVATESALKSIGFSVQPDQPAKKQALKAMEEIQNKLSASWSNSCPHTDDLSATGTVA